LDEVENDLITRVEGPAPLGQMIRANHWLPLVEASLVEADGAPIPVRMLGEKLVVFRAADGRVAVFAEGCPHRGTSLALARNEDCALTCIFHGLKIDVSGAVREVPTAGAHSAEAATNIRVRHFPVHEAGGLIWAWLGAGEPQGFPRFPFTLVPSSHVVTMSIKLPGNYLQALEVTLDTSHTGILHRNWRPYLPWPYNSAEDTQRVFEIRDTSYGFRAGAFRLVEQDKKEVTVSEFIMPFHSSAPPGLPNEGSHHILAPMDDENTLWIIIRWNTDKALQPRPRQDGAPMGASLALPVGTTSGFLGQDREAMKTGSFSGFAAGLLAEDVAVALSMGRIAQRADEYLLAADRSIARVRQQLLRATRQHMAGECPFGADPEIDYTSLMGVAGVIPAADPWEQLRAPRPAR
jgi:nitrite reductase/ring-hydroxylating ferredoxin subunit